MEQLANHLPRNASSLACEPPKTTSSPSKVKPSGSLADYLWLHMNATFPHKWTSALGDNPRATAGMVWAAELAGFTRAQIDAGLSACRNGSDEWPPTLPAFKALCLGIPPFAAVRLDAERAEPFTRLVWQHLDGHRYRTSPADKADRLLREAYELAREHVMRGGELPGESEAIGYEKPVVNVADPQTAAEHLERIRNELGLSKSEAQHLGEEGLRKAGEGLVDVEQSLREHYGVDRKAAAAGPDA